MAKPTLKSIERHVRDLFDKELKQKIREEPPTDEEVWRRVYNKVNAAATFERAEAETLAVSLDGVKAKHKDRLAETRQKFADGETRMAKQAADAADEADAWEALLEPAAEKYRKAVEDSRPPAGPGAGIGARNASVTTTEGA